MDIQAFSGLFWGQLEVKVGTLGAQNSRTILKICSRALLGYFDMDKNEKPYKVKGSYGNESFTRTGLNLKE